MADNDLIGTDVSAAQESESPVSQSFSGKIPRSKSFILEKVNRYAHEGEHDPENWLRHKSHVIVLTYSGKPVYTRYGEEMILAPFFATFSAIIPKI